MSDVGATETELPEAEISDLSKTEERFEADLVAVENSLNEPTNSTMIDEPAEVPVEKHESSDIDAENSILELSALEEQLSDLRKDFSIYYLALRKTKTLKVITVRGKPTRASI